MSRAHPTSGTTAHRRVRDLYEVVGQDGDGHPIRVIDRAMEAYRLGLGDVDVAARCGVHKETVRTWMKDGTTIATDLTTGRRHIRDLSKQERKVLDFVQQSLQAEAEGKMLYLALAEQLARGGQVVKSTRVKVHADGHTETTTTTEQTMPDGAMIRWVLAHRWRDEFGDRVSAEITGPGGGPIQVEQVPPIDQLLADLDRIHAAEEQTDAMLAEAAQPTGD